MILTQEERREKRRRTIRRRVFGTSERPRLSIFRSSQHLYAQAVDDYQGKTIFGFSTTNEKFRKTSPERGNIKAAQKLGQIFGPELIAKGIKKIIFDRSGYKYHGRIKALAESLREAGLEF